MSYTIVVEECHVDPMRIIMMHPKTRHYHGDMWNTFQIDYILYFIYGTTQAGKLLSILTSSHSSNHSEDLQLDVIL